MSQEGKSDHWADLSADLGATPPPAKEEQLGAEQRGVEPAPEPPVARPSKPAAKRASADWSRLASELGLAPPSPEPSVPEPPEAQLRLPVEPPRGKEPKQLTVEPPQAEPACMDALGIDEDEGVELPGFEEVADEVAETAGEIEDDELSDEIVADDSVALADIASTEGEAKRPGKRRRKRRRRPRKPEETEANSIEAPSAERLEDEGAVETGEGLESATLVTDDVDEVVSDSASTGAPTKSKRRRRRRSSSRKKDGEKAQAEASDSIPESDDVTGDGDFDDQDDSSGSGSGKSIHRGIPTWREAVDIVIATNMESRAKRPNGRSSSRQRSGRRSPRKDKSGEKSP